MILPSDETPRRPDDPEDSPPWHNEPEPPGFFDEDEEDDVKVHNPAPEGWRAELSADLADALMELKEIEDPAEDFDPPEPPDLFAFYSDLTAMRQDLHTLSVASLKLLQQEAAASSSGERPPPSAAAPLLEVVIGLHDELETSRAPVPPSLPRLLQQLGLERVRTEGQPFDPATMRAKEKAKTGQRVTAELQSGWLCFGTLLRPAKVSVK